MFLRRARKAISYIPGLGGVQAFRIGRMDAVTGDHVVWYPVSLRAVGLLHNSHIAPLSKVSGASVGSGPCLALLPTLPNTKCLGSVECPDTTCPTVLTDRKHRRLKAVRTTTLTCIDNLNRHGKVSLSLSLSPRRRWGSALQHDVRTIIIGRTPLAEHVYRTVGLMLHYQYVV